MCDPPDKRLSLLFATAGNFEIFNHVDINYYTEFIRSMNNVAAGHSRSGDKERAYLLFVRAMLCIRRLSTHKDFNKLGADVRSRLKCLLLSMLTSAEKLKDELKVKYTTQYVDYMQSLNPTNDDCGASPPESNNPLPDSTTQQVCDRMKDGSIDFKAYEHRDPKISRSSDPNSQIHSQSNLTSIYLSQHLIDDFLGLAENNTKLNIETCGILCGKLVDGNFLITNLLIPKQRGSSDSCVTHNEEEVYQYLERLDLIALGWIHTHPIQTAFLSAVDLHCQLPYQALLPEAIAIVCAPKYQVVKCFSLTADHGIPFLSKCKQSGFHPHTTHLPLYSESQHVVFDSSVEHICDDLRYTTASPIP